MKILLLNPPSLPGKTTDRRQRCTASVPKGWSHPPIGLGYLASMIKSKGQEADILDSVLEGYNAKEVIEYIHGSRPDFIISLVGLFTFPYDSQVLDMIKKDSKIPIVVTGESVCALPDRILSENKSIDYGIIGEPESSIFDLMELFDGKRKEKDIKGLVYRKNGKVKINEQVPIQDLDAIPFPDRSLIKNDKYHCIPFFSEVYTDIMTSRGCPYKCKFCTSKKYWGSKFRTRSVENILAEIRECVEKYNIRNFFVGDDLFIMDKERVKKITKGLKEIGIKWALETRVDLVDEESLKMLADSGCIYVHYGTESGSQRILDYYKKGITVQQIRDAVKWTKKADIFVCATFLIGNPEETKEDVEKTINLAKELKFDYVHFSPLVPFPSCDFFNEYKMQGLLKHEDFIRYTKPNIVFKAKYLTDDEIRAYIKKAYKVNLFRPWYIFRQFQITMSKKDPVQIKQLAVGAFWTLKTFFQ